MYRQEGDLLGSVHRVRDNTVLLKQLNAESSYYFLFWFLSVFLEFIGYQSILYRLLDTNGGLALWHLNHDIYTLKNNCSVTEYLYVYKRNAIFNPAQIMSYEICGLLQILSVLVFNIQFPYSSLLDTVYIECDRSSSLSSIMFMALSTCIWLVQTEGQWGWQLCLGKGSVLYRIIEPIIKDKAPFSLTHSPITQIRQCCMSFFTTTTQ